MYFPANHHKRYFHKLFVRRWYLFHQHLFIAHYWSNRKKCHLIHSIYRKNLDSVINVTNKSYVSTYTIVCAWKSSKIFSSSYMLTTNQNPNFYVVVMDVVILVTDSLENALTKYFLHCYLTKEYTLLRFI